MSNSMELSQQNSSFSKVQPNFQLAWDSTSLGQLKTCPRKYYYNIICGWQPRRLSVHLIFGLHYHSALEHYDHKRSQGLSHEEAQLSAVQHLLCETWDEKLKRPWFSDDPNKNRYTLLRTVAWYLEQFAEDSLETIQLANGKPAVELSFRFDSGLRSSSDEPIFFCGHLDRLANLGSTTYIVDRKTTKSQINEDFFKKFSPDNQFSMYATAAKVIYGGPVHGLIVDGAQVAVTFSRFQRGFATRSEGELDEWFKDSSMWIQIAESFAKASYWPMNDKSCQNYGGCEFRGICSKTPTARAQWLKADFTQRLWDPLQVRGDI